LLECEFVHTFHPKRLLHPNLDSFTTVSLILATQKYCPPDSTHKVRYWCKWPQYSSCRPRNTVA